MENFCHWYRCFNIMFLFWQLTTILLNKTGIITTGKYNVTYVHNFVLEKQCSKSKLIALAGAAESCSNHPIGVAISNYAKEVQHYLKYLFKMDITITLQSHTFCIIS